MEGRGRLKRGQTCILGCIPVFQLVLFAQFDFVTDHETGFQQFVDEMLEGVIFLFELVESDLNGGFADKTFKMPNPNYYLP